MLATLLTEMTDVVLPLGLALVAGAILGLNRWINHKAAGVRTHCLVALGAALSILVIQTHSGSSIDTISRVLAGLVTGIGFLGAGVIIRENNHSTVHGLTTAASLWACALLGATFGARHYGLGLAAVGMMLVVLVFGGPFENLFGRLFGHHQSDSTEHDSTSS